MRKFWTKKEDDILYNNYYDLPLEQLQELLPNRTWTAIKLRARKLDLYRSFSHRRSSNVKNLISGSLIGFYWVGFILADGYIQDNNRLYVTLSSKDKDHLNKLALFLNINLRTGRAKVNDKIFDTATISCKDVDNIPVLCNIFNIDSNKSENPPDFNSYVFTEEQLLALIIGFIDGDGSITKMHKRKDFNLRIKCHSSWVDNLYFIEQTIYNYCKLPNKQPSLTKINNQGYASLCISNNEIIKKLKIFTIEKSLPILERKWDKIIL